MTNPYEVLGLQQGASKEEIRNAYKLLAQQYHPGQYGHLETQMAEMARKKFDEINFAYDILMAEPEPKKNNFFGSKSYTSASSFPSSNNTTSSSSTNYQSVSYSDDNQPKKTKSIGSIFITLGIILFIIGVFDKITSFNPGPIIGASFLLGPGIAFEAMYFSSRKDPGILVPGGILTTIGVAIASASFGLASITWPLYILAPAVGLFQLYHHGRKNPGLLVPVITLGTIAGLSFLATLAYKLLSSGSIILIIIGIYLLSRHKKQNN